MSVTMLETSIIGTSRTGRSRRGYWPSRNGKPVKGMCRIIVSRIRCCAFFKSPLGQLPFSLTVASDSSKFDGSQPVCLGSTSPVTPKYLETKLTYSHSACNQPFLEYDFTERLVSKHRFVDVAHRLVTQLPFLSMHSPYLLNYPCSRL